MSIESVSWALNLDDPVLNPTDRLVLVGICNHDGDGGAWPSQATLARYVGTTDRTVRRAITRLVERGWITVHEHGGGTLATRPDRRPNLYTVNHTNQPRVDTDVHPSERVDTDDRADTDDRTGGHPRPNGWTLVTERVDTGVQVTIQEPSIEPSAKRASTAEHLANTLADMLEARGNKRPTVTAAWVTDMDRLLRIDGRTPDEVDKVLRWLDTASDEVAQFWQPNIRCPKKLRDQWDHMGEQYRRQRSTPVAAVTTPKGWAGLESFMSRHANDEAMPA